ncbi:MAG: rod shape-determining protein MreC [Alphaproteobacteria bacterium]
MRRGRSNNRLSYLRLWLQRFSLVILLVASLALIVIGKVDAPWAERARTALSGFFTPLFEAVAEPFESVGNWATSFEEIKTVQRENAELKAEVARLRQLETQNRQFERENKELRRLLNAGPRDQIKAVAARVIADTGGVYVRSLLVRAGLRDGIEKGRAVISGDGLAGRVTEVGERSSRVMLITDVNSRIPVLLEKNGEKAVLAGDNTERPRLVYLPRTVQVEKGDRLVTSGHGGLIPPGLLAGIVVEVDGPIIRVQPAVNWNRLGQVKILEIESPGAVPGNKPTRALGEVPRR